MIDFKDSENTSSVELEFGDQIKDQIRTHFTLSNIFVILIKFSLIAIGPGVLKAYEQYELNQLEKQFNQINAELQVQKNELQKINKEISLYSGLESKLENFKNRFDILKKLAQERINIIKVLDAIQLNIEFKTEKSTLADDYIFFKSLRVDNQSMKIDGTAKNEKLIEQFLSNLEKEGLFSSIHLGNVKSQKSGKNFSIKGMIALED